MKSFLFSGFLGEMFKETQLSNQTKSTSKKGIGMKRNVCFFLLLAVMFSSAIGEIKGVCYSPFIDGQSPNVTANVPTYAQISADIALLKSVMKKPKIRTFGIDTDYLKKIPAICESLSVAHTVYAWTSFSYSTTWSKARTDLVSFLKIADSLKYSNLEAVGYGYNTLIEYSSLSESDRVAKLKTEISLTRAAIAPYKVKLTSEENWDVYCRYPELADSLDFVSIRIIPQDDLVKLADAVKYVQACYDSVKLRFPTKEVKVSSVGWSTSKSSELEQKIFLDTLTAKVAFDYFLFEFADENWKSGVEARYGLFTSYRDPKSFLADSGSSPVYRDIFSADTSKVDGIVYSYSAFAYPTGMSLPALQGNIDRWADTLKNLSKYTFFTSLDLGKVDGKLTKIFVDNGNNVGLINAVDSSSKIVSINTADWLYYYGKKDSLSRQLYLDDIRHLISGQRKKAKDSAFVVASMTDGNSYYIDSLKKYPEIVSGCDGLMFDFNLSNLIGANKSAGYIDSIIGVYQAILPGKKLIVVLKFWSSITSKEMLLYEEFKKAKAKYGLAIVIDGISYFYNSLAVDPPIPSQFYKYLFPSKFPAVIASSYLSQKEPQSIFGFYGQKIVVGDIKTDASLQVFSLSGRLIKQINIKNNSCLNVEQIKLGPGSFIFKLKSERNVVSGKFLINK